jgi:outer membrane lipoprotein SlyB
LGVRGGVRNRPFLVDWVVFDGKFEFGEVESDIGTLFGGRVTGFVRDVVFGGKIEDFKSVLGEDEVVGEFVDITFNIISNSEGFDLVLKVNNDFEVVVTSVMSDSVFASVSLGQVESFTIISLDDVLVGSGTLTTTFTANITSTAFTVFLAW